MILHPIRLKCTPRANARIVCFSSEVHLGAIICAEDSLRAELPTTRSVSEAIRELTRQD